MLGAIRVLIAEDSKIISGMLNNILANHYRINVVSLVNNGIDAYKSIVSIKPDFVVMEIDLPLMGGIELLKLLKKENIQVNILVMTSLTKNKDLSSRALELGALDIIYKPRNVSIDFLKDNVLNKIIEISKNKAQNIINTGADIVLTTCPACVIGIIQGLQLIKPSGKKRPKVMNIVDFLAKAEII